MVRKGRESGNTLRIRMVAALLGVFLTVYTCYHLTSFFRTDITTMLATEDCVEQTATGSAVLFREETLLRSNGAGFRAYEAENGSRVRKDTELLTVYTGGNELTSAYRLLEEQIAILDEASEAGDTLSGLEQLRQSRKRALASLLSNLSDGNAAAGSKEIEAIRLLYCRMEALTNDSFSLKETRAALEAEQRTLLSAAGDPVETLKAPESGYFFRETDGYGEVCSFEALKTMDISALGELILEIGKVPDATEGDEVGTLVTDAEWYLAVLAPLGEEALACLTEGREYPVEFPGEDGLRINMKLCRMTAGSGEKPSMLVFSTLRMPAGFSYLRLQTVRFVYDRWEGFSIPSSALRLLDGERGVYVLEGSVVYFKRAEVLHQIGSRCLIKLTDPSPDGDYFQNRYEYLQRYDSVILSGTRLFHGRVLSG